jgi:glutamate racemase
LIAYKIKNGEVKAVYCEKMEYPLRDTDDDVIYINSHYTTIAEAYKHALGQSEAWLKSKASEIQQSRSHTAKLETELADKCIQYLRIKEEAESLCMEKGDE